MAKLSAQGKEIYRTKKEIPMEDGRKPAIHYRAIFENRKILKKYQVYFENGERHDWGWKVHGKLKPLADVEQWLDLHIQQGWKLI